MIASNLWEAPEEKRLRTVGYNGRFFVVYVSFSEGAAWAAVSSVLPLELFLFSVYISGGEGGGKTCALSSFAILRRFLL